MEEPSQTIFGGEDLELDKYLQELMPNGDNFQLLDFQTGLGLDDAAFDEIEAYLRLSVKESGILDLYSIDDLDANQLVSETAEEMATYIAELRKGVPQKWIWLWCGESLVYYWNLEFRKREAVHKGKQPQVIHAKKDISVALPPTPDRSPTPQLAPLRLGQMYLAFSLYEVNDHMGQKEYALISDEIPITCCFAKGNSLDLLNNVQLELFRYHAEIKVTKTDWDDWDFRHMQLCYRKPQDGTLRPLTKQQHFEVALSHLFNARETLTSDKLEFCFLLEDATAKKNRLNAEKARERLKATADKKKKDVTSTAAKLQVRPTTPSKYLRHQKSNSAPAVPAVPPEHQQLTPARRKLPGPAGKLAETGLLTPDPTPPKSGAKPSSSIVAQRTSRRRSLPFSSPERTLKYSTRRGRVPIPPRSSSLPRTQSTSEATKVVAKPQSNRPNLSTPPVKNEDSFRARTTTASKAVKRFSGVLFKPRTREGSGELQALPYQPKLDPDELANLSKFESNSTATTIPTGFARFSFGAKNRNSKPPPHDPYEERCKRYKTFYETSSTTIYRRGGDQVFENERIGSLVSSNIVVENGEAEVEEDAEDQISHDNQDGGYAIQQLQGLQDMDGLNQIRDSKGTDETVKRWKLCCLVFQIDPSKTGINETVKLEGLKSRLYQYQAYGVYWQMRTSRVVGGGFLADEMGLGKTLTFLAYIVAERQLAVLWKWVLESRAAGDGKHLRPDQCHKHDKCPSQEERPNWIACPCASSNPTSRWGPKPGLRLACVPPSLIATWRDQWNTHVVENVKPLDMKLRIAHPPTMGPGPLVIQDVRHNANKKYLGAQKNELQKKGHYGQDTAQVDQERYLILTTRDAYNQWVRTFEYDATAKSFTQSIAGLMVNTKNRGIVFGIGMIDECHEEYHKGKGRSGVLLDLPPPPTAAVDAPFLWGYSGTPLSQTPRELEGVLAAIEGHASKTWENEDRYSPFTNQELDRLCKDFDKLIKKGTKDKAAVVEIINRLRPFLKTFMIRRTAEGSWFGRPLIKLKPHIHHDIVLKHNDAYDKHIEQLDQVVQEEIQRKLQELQLSWEVADKHTRAPKMPTKLTFNTECRLQAKLRIMATFPALSILAKKPYNMNFSIEECQQYRSPQGEKGSPYLKHLNQIVESSPKAMYLHWFISQVDKRFELDKQNELVYKKEASAIEQKIVILTYFEPVALILKLFIEKLIKGKRGRVGLVYSRMKQKDRTTTIEAFTDVLSEKGERKHKENYQILIGTTRLIGAGLQLTRASHVVLMEPDFEFFRELQGYDRVHRIGQKNFESYSYRFIDEGSAIEQRILKRQKERNEFTGRFVGTQADLEREKDLEAGLVLVREPKVEYMDVQVSPKSFPAGERPLPLTPDDSTIGIGDETSKLKRDGEVGNSPSQMPDIMEDLIAALGNSIKEMIGKFPVPGKGDGRGQVVHHLRDSKGRFYEHVDE